MQITQPIFITNLIAAFNAKGYHAFNEVQDRENPPQVVIQINSVDIEKETAVTYRYSPEISIVIMADAPEIDFYVKDITLTAEGAVTPDMRDFQITHTEIVQLGTTHLLTVYAKWTEIIYTGVT